jgi:flagellar biosynthesis/type III secretory pathway protein FliH
MNDLSEVHAMLSERVKEWTEQWKQQGIEQGIEQGLAAGRRREAGLVLRQLQRRIGPIPATLTEQIQDLPLERIEALGEALLDFTAVADLETWRRQH